MNKIRVVIVDDESGGREVLTRLLLRHEDIVEIVSEAANAVKAYEVIRETNPDLVFLDVQMPQASGFALLKMFEVITFQVIFVTGFDQYAIDAIRFNALDYLLKPVVISELDNALKRAVMRLRSSGEHELQITPLLQSMDLGSKSKAVRVHTGEKVTVIRSPDIVSIIADGRYCTLHCVGNAHYTTAHYLRDYESYLLPTEKFIRLSKSVLINTDHIREYTKGEICIISMLNNQVFEAPRRKKQEIIDMLKRVDR